MGKNTTIEWTHHTFNPWWGCTKVSPACKNCYALTWAKRLGQGSLWGANSTRRTMSVNHWKEPMRWNMKASRDGQKRRVFCASMADWAEPRDELDEWREKLWEVIADTPWLDWLLLTKRVEHIGDYVPWSNNWPDNVWLGTTIENQKYANIRIPILLDYPAKVHFLSCEPLLGKVDLSNWANQLDWIIAGGETGGKSRPMHPSWVRSLRDQCREFGMAFHFKQWGNWFPIDSNDSCKQKITVFDGERMARVSKKKAGRVLDGKTWDDLPMMANQK